MKIILIFILLSFTLPAFSCRITFKLTDEMKQSADVVFIGKAINFQKIGKNQARLQFNTLKTIRGKNANQWSAIWDGHLFPIPADLNEFKKVHGKKTEVGISLKDKTPAIINKPCSESYLIKLP